MTIDKNKPKSITNDIGYGQEDANSVVCDMVNTLFSKNYE